MQIHSGIVLLDSCDKARVSKGVVDRRRQT